MSRNRVIVVVGATGSQGAGLCEAILSDPQREFACRAITRNPKSDAAKRLAARGVEVVAADLDDETRLSQAFQGSYGVFGVTNYPEFFSVEREQQQALNIARAARSIGAGHVIWSTLDDTTKWLPVSDPRMPTLEGGYKCPHSDAKGQIDHVFTDLGLPVTFLLTCFYWDNFYRFRWGPQKGVDGTYRITLPIGAAKMPGIAAEDIGKCALGIFKQHDRYLGQYVGIAGEHLSGQEIAQSCSVGLGIRCTFEPMLAQIYRSQGFHGADDLGNMFQIFEEFESQYRASRSVETARALAPTLMNFSQWLTKHRDEIPLG